MKYTQKVDEKSLALVESKLVWSRIDDLTLKYG